MNDFYKEAIDRLVAQGVLAHQMRLLVVCGGETDRDVLCAAGFQNVVISNLDTRMVGDEFAPFDWSFQDAEQLAFKDDTFDFCIVHSGLHHCYSPHRALLEMYRVSRKGLLLFEPYDNLATRLGILLNIGQEYEHAAVFYNNCLYGGVRNTSVPNYVYRWTRREIIKTIACAAPHAKHQFQFIHRLRIPWVPLKGRKSKLPYFAVICAMPLLWLLELVCPRQCNNFAAVILKPASSDALQPWLLKDHEGVKLNTSWLEERYNGRP